MGKRFTFTLLLPNKTIIKNIFGSKQGRQNLQKKMFC